MTSIGVSRRKLLVAGACALAGAAPFSATAAARTGSGSSATAEEVARKYYKAWETKNWGPFDILLSENFTFTSANDDDHISKSAFKKGCWDTQIDFIERFDLERVFGSGNEAFVKYLCHTKNGKSFRNVEYFRVRDGKVDAIECYFGGKSTFASAVSSGI